MKFTKHQQIGVIVLILFVVLIQSIIYFDGISYLKLSESASMDEIEKQQWLSHQKEIDSLKGQKNIYKIYPFNPNFITDYKGYKLGMSLQEIDRLHQFRNQNKFVNSAEEFQKITKISDSLLKKIAPYFKFPDWVTQNNNKINSIQKIVKTDVNQATISDLEKVSGIGNVLAQRILQEKEKLGGFVNVEQLSWIFGISPEVYQKLKEQFYVTPSTTIKKLPINEATLKEIAQFPYFNYALAKEIVIYRTLNGNELNASDLTKIKNFPTDKVNTITLYLHF